MKAIKQIVAGYVSLNDRQALEKLRHHRQQLLDDVGIHGVSGLKASIVSDILREEIEVIEDALARVVRDRSIVMGKNFEEIETLKPMDCGTFTDAGLRVMYDAIHGALEVDNEFEAGGKDPKFRVRSMPEWKRHAGDIEAEMLKRGLAFDVIDWTNGRTEQRAS